MATVATIDFDAVFAEIAERLESDARRRLSPPEVLLYDGDWNLRGECGQIISASFGFVMNETGIGTLDMPADYYLSKWAINVDARATTNIHVVVNKDGARWSGRMDSLVMAKDSTGRKTVRLTFKHDYEELKNLLCWANPFLPAEIQFPKVWVLFGRAKWGLKTTLLCNIMRLENSLWMLPSNPIASGQQGGLNRSTWSMTVKPDFEPDATLPAIVHSRFKTMHEASKKICADGQLVWEGRRYLPGDEEPWPGANLRYGCLVWDLVDKSAFTTGTSFGGSFFDGLVHELINIGGDGKTETVEQLDDPNVPGEYFQPGFRGTNPLMPACVFFEDPQTGIESSEYTHKPATFVQTVAGGSSMPGVNEAISAGVQMVGDLTAMIPGVPPLGGVADTLLKPLYTDVFLAFGAWKNIQRIERLGWSHYKEQMAPGADRAYTLAYVLAQRAAMYASREINRCTLTVVDGMPYRIGESGLGDFFLGDRVGFVIDGMPPGRIYVEQVSELVLAWDRDTTPGWKITIGEREAQDPIARAFEELQDLKGLLSDLGVL